MKLLEPLKNLATRAARSAASEKNWMKPSFFGRTIVGKSKMVHYTSYSVSGLGTLMSKQSRKEAKIENHRESVLTFVTELHIGECTNWDL